jgi:hypothetical protein
MTIQFSTNVRNLMLDAIEAAVGTSAILKIRSGAVPATCATADAGTPLASYSLAADWSPAAASGVKSLASLPLTTTGLAVGSAGHYRIYASDGVTCHEQGTVTVTGGGGDMTVDNTSITVGQTVNITAFSKTMGGA